MNEKQDTKTARKKSKITYDAAVWNLAHTFLSDYEMKGLVSRMGLVDELAQVIQSNIEDHIGAVERSGDIIPR